MLFLSQSLISLNLGLEEVVISHLRLIHPPKWANKALDNMDIRKSAQKTALKSPKLQSVIALKE